MMDKMPNMIKHCLMFVFPPRFRFETKEKMLQKILPHEFNNDEQIIPKGIVIVMSFQSLGPKT